MGALTSGSAFPLSGVPCQMGMHSHILSLEYWNSFRHTGGHQYGCAFPHTGLPQYVGLLSHVSVFTSMWECMPMRWGTPIYGNAFPYGMGSEGIPRHGVSMWSHAACSSDAELPLLHSIPLPLPFRFPHPHLCGTFLHLAG